MRDDIDDAARADEAQSVAPGVFVCPTCGGRGLINPGERIPRSLADWALEGRIRCPLGCVSTVRVEFAPPTLVGASHGAECDLCGFKWSWRVSL